VLRNIHAGTVLLGAPVPCEHARDRR
jgi:hypothetical protein